MNELDLILRKLDELNHEPGRDLDVLSEERCWLLEEGLRLLIEEIKQIKEWKQRELVRRTFAS